MNIDSPFKVTSPEDLSPEEIKGLFVKSYTELNILKNRKHTIINGSRGNGKSMLLRFLEPRCQILDLNGSTHDYLNSRNSFIGVYIPFKEGYFNKTDLQSIDQNIAYTLSKHLINLHIIGCFIDILEGQLSELLSRTKEKELAKKIFQLLDTKKLHEPQEISFAGLKEVLHLELSYISKYLCECNFPGHDTKYSGNYSDYSTLILPLFKSTGKIISSLSNTSFFLLFDEGDRLYDFQKKYINSMIANRDHKFISIKLASKIDGYDYLLTESQTRIQIIHDYETITLDELYTHSRNTYFNKIKEIANRRLEAFGINSGIDAFLPSSSYEEKLLEKIRRQTEAEWENLPNQSKTKDKNNYVDKYAVARLFQYLAKKKLQKRYSGFSNIVHYSSGIIRNFLHPCHLMFEKAIETHHDFHKDESVPETLQNQVIHRASRDFLKELDETIKGLGKHATQQKDIITNLKKLINALGKVYYDRLTDKRSRDPRIISFALIDEPDEKMQEILNYAVKESYFHKVYTSSKSGGGKLECYVLNRALCPVFKLDLSSLRGRILISTSELWGLLKAPNKTSKSIFQREVTQVGLFDQEIVDESYE